MVLREIVGHIGAAFSPDKLELFLFYSILDPKVSHIESLGQFLTHFGVEDAGRGFIIIVERSSIRGLGMSELGEGSTHGAGALTCKEKTTRLSFSRRRDDVLQCAAHDVNRSIRKVGRGGRGVRSQDEPGCRTGSSLR